MNDIIASKLNEKIKEIYNEDINVMDMLEVPKEKEKGDLALPCFKLSRKLHKSPVEIAEDLSNVQIDGVNKVQAVSGYLNFFIDFNKECIDILKEVLEKKDKYGQTIEGEKQNITIDYSSPNIAKPFHLGHFRTTIIGRSLYNLYKARGYNVIGINHLRRLGQTIWSFN